MQRRPALSYSPILSCAAPILIGVSASTGSAGRSVQSSAAIKRIRGDYILAVFHNPLVAFKSAVEGLSEDDLQEYAREHVLYEITQFVRAAQAIEAACAGLFPMNFAIEVFALHLRNLLDFFAPRNLRKTDICAQYLFEGWESPELNVYLTEARRMADKHIAHLTVERTSDPDMKTWAVEPIVRSIVPMIERFAAGAELVCDGFRRSVAERLAELPPTRDWREMPPRPDLAPGS